MTSLGKKIFNSCFVIGFALIVGGGAYLCFPKYSLYQDLCSQRDALNGRISEKQAEIDAIKRKQWRFDHDLEFVESLARQQRRMYPGELVFVFDRAK